MLRRFAFTLIALTTIVYGSVFLLAKHHGTGFFDEILIQMNRFSASLANKAEINQSKFILKLIMDNEHPPDNWKTLISGKEKSDTVTLFYHYKTWLTQSGLTHEDVAGSYPIFKSSTNQLIILNMRYGKNKPVLQFPFLASKDNGLITGLFFPVNELAFSADLNKDGKIDHQDVELAAKRKK